MAPIVEKIKDVFRSDKEGSEQAQTDLKAGSNGKAFGEDEAQVIFVLGGPGAGPSIDTHSMHETDR